MTPPNRPVPAPVQEIWKSFATTASGKDPLRTITSVELRASEATKSLVAEPSPTAVSVSDLPSVPVMTSTPRGEPVATDFEVTRVLGEGGMGRVLLARQKSLQRDVALKVLKGDEKRRDVVATLLAEAVITGSIEHPCIVPVHALGRDKNGLPVMVMKRIDGVSWRKLFEDPEHALWTSLGVDATDRLDAHLEILMSVCNAVHFAHSRGIIHRDIKLDNVMIGGFGEVYLVDWGIAMRLSEIDERPPKDDDFEAPVGTLAYMAPEMAMGDICNIDARTDVYLLGATLHYLLTGKPRHRGESPLDLLLSARDSEPFEYGPTVSAELAAICHRAMDVERDKRFSTALEMRQALASYRRHRGSLALSANAFAKMAEMEKGSEIKEHQLIRAMTECRFAFMQALETWSANEPARDGLDKVLGRMIEHEIARRNIEGARELFAELSVPRPELDAKINGLGEDIAREKANAERLQAMERNADLRIGARFQLAIIAILPVCAGIALFVVSWRGRSHRMSDTHLIAFPLLVATLLVVVFFTFRKRVTTAIARRAFGLLLLYPFALLGHRVFGIVHHESMASILTTDLVISAGLSAAFAIAILARLAWMCIWFLAAAVAISVYPEHATQLFMAGICIGGLILSALWARMLKPGPETKKI